MCYPSSYTTMLRRGLLLGSSFLISFACLVPTTHCAALDQATPASSNPSDPQLSTLSFSASPSPPSTLIRRDPDPAKNKFVTPEAFGVSGDFSNDTSYPTGSHKIEIEWISEWQSVDLSVCQPTTGSSYGCYTLIRATLSKGFHWPVENVTDHMSGFASSPILNVYYFQLAQTNTQVPTIKSHYLNITKGADDTDSGDGSSDGDGGSGAATSNGTTDASGPGASATPSSIGTSTSTPSTTDATGSAASGFRGLTTPAQLAIYIVASVVAAGLAGAGIFWLVLNQRKRKRAGRLAKIAITQSTSTLTSPIPLQEMHSDSHVHETGKALPHEIASREIPMELPAEIPGLAVSTYDDDEWDIEDAEHTKPHEGIR